MHGLPVHVGGTHPCLPLYNSLFNPCLTQTAGKKHYYLVFYLACQIQAR